MFDPFPRSLSITVIRHHLIRPIENPLANPCIPCGLGPYSTFESAITRVAPVPLIHSLGSRFRNNFPGDELLTHHTHMHCCIGCLWLSFGIVG